MTASLFPKHTSLSDAPSKPAPPPPQGSAIDRYLGKNFFDPKKAGKMPERGTKPAQPSKASQVNETTTKRQAPTASAGKGPDTKAASLDPKPEATQKAPITTPQQPSPTPTQARSDVAERSLPSQADQKPPAKPAAPPAVEPQRTSPQVAPVQAPVVEELPRKKRKVRKTGVEAPAEQKPTAADSDTRRRAILAQKRRTRGKGR